MKIPLFKIYSDSKDVKEVTSAIKSGMHWCIGPQIEEFEKKICEYSGVGHCVTFNSGGSALHALMLAHGIGPGDEVIVPSFTFIATAYAPMYAGAKPVFADIEETTLGLDPESVRKRITKKTKAILPIHYGGVPCRIKELREVADDASVALIEDAAEAFGAKIGSSFVGTFGHSAIYSFCQNKIFSTSEGGCAITDDDALYEKLKLIASYGRVCSGDYFCAGTSLDYISLGYNWRLSSIQAALGVSQLQKVEKIIKMRVEVADYYNKELDKIDDVETIRSPNECYSVFQLYTIRVKGGSNNRDKLMEFLAKKGVSSKVYFDPVHKYSIFRGKCSEVHLPITEKVSEEVLSIPIYPHMRKKESEFVVKSIKEFFKGGA